MAMSPAEYYEGLQDATMASASPATQRAHPPESRLTGNQIDDFLGDRRLLSIATVRPNGTPHQATNYFVVWDGVFWMPVMDGTARLQNILANPYASLMVTDGQGPAYTMVIVEGTAEFVPTASYDVAQAVVEKQGVEINWASGWICVTPQKLYSFGGEASNYSVGKGLVKNFLGAMANDSSES